MTMTGSNTNGNGNNGGNSKNDSGFWENLKEILAPIIAVVVILGFALLVIYLLIWRLGADELQWTRAVYLLNGVEALAFAAGGYFFGKEVHRRQAAKAEQKLDETEQKLDEATESYIEAEKRAEQAETKGNALAGDIRSKRAAQADKASTYATLSMESAAPLMQADFKELEERADELFPAG